jgi:DNA end-binding protein Ku
MSSSEFEPEKYHDEYRERFLAMIDQKVKGQEITVAPGRSGARQKSRRYFCRTKAKSRSRRIATSTTIPNGRKISEETAEGLGIRSPGQLPSLLRVALIACWAFGF